MTLSPFTKDFLVLMLQQHMFKDGVMHAGAFSAHPEHWFMVEGMSEGTCSTPRKLVHHPFVDFATSFWVGDSSTKTRPPHEIIDSAPRSIKAFNMNYGSRPRPEAVHYQCLNRAPHCSQSRFTIILLTVLRDGAVKFRREDLLRGMALTIRKPIERVGISAMTSLISEN
jgi:hypothetical protein